MAKQIKPKYPNTRVKTSEAFNNGLVSTEVLTSNPVIKFTINVDNSPDLVSDLQNAIDRVLEHHGK